jgi:hypothetical protein
MVEIKFSTDDDTIQQGGYAEVASMLRAIADNIEGNRSDSILEDKIVRDTNGNKVGRYTISI